MRIIVHYKTEDNHELEVDAATPTELEQHELRNPQRAGFLGARAKGTGRRVTVNLANVECIEYPDEPTPSAHLQPVA
jgi:hypothetical protein